MENMTTKWNIDAEIIGYIYSPNGMLGSDEEIVFFPEEVAAWYEEPDPEMPGLGMPWWVPVLDEMLTDNSAQAYIKGYFDNGAQPGTIMSLDPSVQEEDARRYIEQFNRAGADAEKVINDAVTTFVNLSKKLFNKLGPPYEVIRGQLQFIADQLSKLLNQLQRAIKQQIPVVSLIVQCFTWVDDVQKPMAGMASDATATGGVIEEALASRKTYMWAARSGTPRATSAGAPRSATRM